VAAGLTGGEIGSDIGGSIRTPSGWCGVFGHKATWGIIPGRGHIPPTPGSLGEVDLGVFGPIGRSADDLDLGLDVMVGPSDAAARAWRLELPPARHDSLRAYRMALWLDDASAPLDGGVRAVLESAVAALRGAGATVLDRKPVVDLPGLVAAYFKMLYPIVLADMPDDGFENLAAMSASFASDDQSPFAVASRSAAIRHRDWLHLNETRSRTQARFAELFREVDVVLMPIVPVAAISHDHSDPFPARTITIDGAPAPYLRLFSWIAPATFAHLPATAVPIGRTSDGLPVGLQVMGPYLEDRTTIDVARRVTEIVGGYTPPPEA
jgi:amidase